MHIHAGSKAQQSAFAPSTVYPGPALLNSDLEQQARTAFSSALSEPEQARTVILSGATGGAAAGQSSLFEFTGGTGAGLSGHFERTGGAEAGPNRTSSVPAAAEQARSAILSAKVNPVR